MNIQIPSLNECMINTEPFVIKHCDPKRAMQISINYMKSRKSLAKVEYENINDDKRLLLIKMIESKEYSIKIAANMLSIKYTTAKSIWNNYILYRRVKKVIKKPRRKETIKEKNSEFDSIGKVQALSKVTTESPN